MADLPVVARLYMQGRYRRASVQNGPGEALVRKDDALAEIRALRSLLKRSLPLLREVATGRQCGAAASDMLRDFTRALDGDGVAVVRGETRGE